jgi:hypothetical protein
MLCKCARNDDRALVLFGCAQGGPGTGSTTLIDGGKGNGKLDVLGRWQLEIGRRCDTGRQSSTKGASILVSKRSFKDFELHVEFWAGRQHEQRRLHTRSESDERQYFDGRVRSADLDNNPNQQYSTGSLVNVAAVKPIYKAGWQVEHLRDLCQRPADHRQAEWRRHGQRAGQQISRRQGSGCSSTKVDQVPQKCISRALLYCSGMLASLMTRAPRAISARMIDRSPRASSRVRRYQLVEPLMELGDCAIPS